jgi:hypothetical protein
MRSIGISRRAAASLAALVWLGAAPPAGALDWGTFLGPEAVVNTGGTVRDLRTHGSVTFVANDVNLSIFDHSDPPHPALIGNLPIPAQTVDYHPYSGTSTRSRPSA